MVKKAGERGAGQPRYELTPYSVSVSYNTGPGAARGSGADWFGPLTPLKPVAPPQVQGRTWDFPSGYNIQTRPRQSDPISFSDLRAFADGYDFLRLIIETRKDQVERLDWSIKPREKPKNKAQAQKVEADPRIAVVTEFFRKPDGEHEWAPWLRMILEDLLVIDAPALYCERTRGNQLTALVQIDGATIKRIIDDWGRTPRPFIEDGNIKYPPAYQQILKGMPAVDYSTKQVIYKPRNLRVHKAFGYSPVEQIVMTVNIALRRQLFQLQYYTEGNIPEALIGVPEAWNPDQIKAFQDYWDATFSGQTAARRHAKFVPGGLAKTFIQTKEAELKNVFDEWLARVVCFCFSISSQPFVTQVNRSTSDTQKEMSEEEGLSPLKKWIKSLVDGILADEFGSPDLEFSWGDDDEIDALQEMTIQTGYAKAGIRTINQIRDSLGELPDPNPLADTLMVLTATGYVPLNAFEVAQEQAAAATAAAAQAKTKAPAGA